MRTEERLRVVLTLVFVALALQSAAAGAASMSVSLEAPAIDGDDIANYGPVTGRDKWFSDSEGSGRPKGQTFTTGETALYLKALTYQVADTNNAEPTKEYVLRVGTIDRVDPGDSETWVFTEIYREEAVQDFSWNGGEYMTWTFGEPFLLEPETEYGIDVGMTSSTSHWQTGIPYINRTADEYSGGTRYMSGTTGRGLGDTSMNNVGGDMLFHLDLATGEIDPGDEQFKRGDVNVDNKINIADAISLLGHLFSGDPEPVCPDAADNNDDGKLNIADAIAVLGYLFGGAGPLPEPFDACGADPTGDALSACDYPPANCQ